MTESESQTGRESNETAEAGDQGDVPETTRRIEGMATLGFFPADHAVEESGKVYANGAYWTVLRFPTFPAALPTCSIVAVLLVPYHQSQTDHTLAIRLEGGQGEQHPMRVEGGFRTTPSIDAEFGETGAVPFAVSVPGLTFERPGAYRFILEVDGDFVADYGFRVIQSALPGLSGLFTPPRG